ncbi:MAG: flagellin N-terminal helical domain-containing protein [Phycisphaerales bacterium]
MSRINTNVPSMIAQRVLGANNNALTTSLERLSTGLRINRGKDDPAGLIASQNLRAEKAALGAAIKNAERADQVVNIAEGGLNEISGLLTDLQSLVTSTANTAGLSQEEKEANQLQIDSILQTIDRVAGTTSFQGSKLLNGNFDYKATSVNASVDSFKVNAAKLEYNGDQDVSVIVTESAQVAGYIMSFGGAAALDLTAADDQFVIEIAGVNGSRELSFASGTTLDTIQDTVNTFTDVTGVSAVASGNFLRLTSTEYGKGEFVSVRVVDDGGQAGGVNNLAADDTLAGATGTLVGAFTAVSNTITDEGRDVGATINGVLATTKGLTAAINTDFLNVELTLTDTAGGTVGAFDAFTIESGGADFQLAGRVDISGKVSLGIGNVASRSLGASTITEKNDSGTDVDNDYTLADLASGRGINVVDGNLSGAQDVIESAIREVSTLRGRLGAFQANTIGATIRNLGVSLENTAAAESVIRDVDFASETAALTRSQILSQSAQTTLAQANFQPQNALQLLG